MYQMLDEPVVMDDDITIAPTQVAIHQHAAAGSLQSLATVAQSLAPRDMGALGRAAVDVGTRLGRSAFYSWQQGDGMIEGATIDLAYALLGVYGRALARVEIVSVEGARVTLRGIAIDVQNVVSVERDYTYSVQPAPGKYAHKPDQVQRWETMQIQAAASKAVRGAILGMLPAWVVDAAIAAARKQASALILGGLTLADAIQRDIAAWRCRPDGKPAGPGLDADVMEARVGKPCGLWTIADLETLRADYRAMGAGEIAPAAFRASVMAKAAQAATPERPPPGVRAEAKAAPKPETKAPEAKATPEVEPGLDAADLAREWAPAEEPAPQPTTPAKGRKGAPV